MTLVCPITGMHLVQVDGELATADGSRRYQVEDGIARLFVTDTERDGLKGPEGQGGRITQEVREFYEDTPFPNYNEFDSIKSFIKRASESLFARLLSDQIPMNSKILEIGCGTAQLSNYLASTCMAHVYAADMSMASLKLGRDFAKANQISGIDFLQMNLFKPCIDPAAMDIVISNGVLHHTHDTRAAFMRIAPLVKSGGHIVLGLYNSIGRLRTDLRRHLYKVFKDRILFLDPHLRQNLSAPKRRAWIRDQYLHPQERKHNMSEVLSWFEAADFEFVNSVPKIVGEFAADERLFRKNMPGTSVDRVLTEIGMLFSHFGGEGGLFIMIGQER